MLGDEPQAGRTMALGSPTRVGPLAPTQRGLYVLWQAGPESTAYNSPFRLRVRDRLDPSRVRHALEALARRHEVLRTRFELRGSEVRQVVEAEPVVELEVAEPGRLGDIRDFVRPFRLDRLPLFRLRIAGSEEGGSELYIDLHHIVFDGASVRYLVEDLLDLYAGDQPPALACQYLDAAAWLNERLEAAAPEHERHWLGVLDPPPPPLDVPLDRPRRELRGGRGEVTARRLETAWLGALRVRARAEGTKLLVQLLAPYVAVLARITGQTDLVVGFPAGGRDHPDLTGLVGMFVNTTLVRARFERGTRLSALRAAIAVQTGEALRHQAYPLDRLVERVGRRRDFGRNPLFDALLVLRNPDIYRFRRAGTEVDVDILSAGVSQLDLSLKVIPRPDAVVVELEYDSDLFERASADHLLDGYLDLVGEVVRGEDPVVLPAAARSAAPPPLPNFRLEVTTR